jgi:acetone carboxylase gamma subunit
MNHPFREKLAVITDSGAQWIHCAQCSQSLCKLGDSWKKRCTRRTFPPTHAGPLMSQLVGHYLLEKLYCPSCGALLDSELVETDFAG